MVREEGGELVIMPTRTEPGGTAGWAELSDAAGGERGGGSCDHGDWSKLKVTNVAFQCPIIGKFGLETTPY